VRRALLLIALAGGLTWASCAAGAPVGRYPAGREEPGEQGRANVVYALGNIRTVAGTSALQRMQACGFKIKWDTSWVARQAKDMPAYGTSAGDVTVQVVFDRQASNAALGRDLVARWFVQKGRVVPNSGWAKLIQSSPSPMKIDPPARC
jgi:hypothetical protein